MNEEKKNHIPGIYNYCDRWCEKCGFTSQCLLFSNESKIATFEILNDRLPDAEEMMDKIFDINKDDAENDFDLPDGEAGWEDFSDEEDKDDFLFGESDEDEENELNIDVDETEPPYLIEELADQYLHQSMDFIKTIDEKFNFSTTPKDCITLPQLKKIYDCFETVSWYHAFIFVKIKRASHGKKEFLKFKDEDLKEFSKYDSDGTAKVVAISIKNSTKALSELHEYLPDYSTDIIKLSSLLNRIFKELESGFPDYSKFKRPGFDN
jgi:hypothetical protein